MSNRATLRLLPWLFSWGLFLPLSTAQQLDAVPEAANVAVSQLAGRLGLDESDITLVTVEAVDWPDACLGISTPGLLCAQVITPGYRVVLAAQGQTYTFHTDAIGASVQSADTLDASASVRLETPQAEASVSSPLQIRGEARGTWYFEGSFPVRLVADDGTELAYGNAEAQGEWTTEAFVPFTAELTFLPTTGQAMLILEKANPSDLAENTASLRLPLTFTGPEK